eukprot:TRINITY_DN16712_c0_g2_i1.p1 TRINITY_DN16712_c0_g2~~TRINITY_DN16712_c0_g2_i1.p1  ORF type:complete len:524 (+),score=165.76 TRINITY_DN16712_c0_g2_i1:47-1573(+)
MFYSTFILTKKGPLAKVWLAAHWEKKLTKNEVQLVDLKETVVQIIDPSVPISCRTQGELLLGCTRIFANKVSILLNESHEARLLLVKDPKGKAVVHNIEQEVTTKKAITIPVGIEDLMQLPELASFNVADMIGAGEADNELGLVLKGADDFIPDDWFQQKEERPAGSRSVSRMREEPASEFLPPITDTSDQNFVQKFMASSPSTGGPGLDMPEITTDGTVLPETPALPPPPPVVKQAATQVDKDTRLPTAVFKKWLQSSSDIVRGFVPVPPTEEALGCRQDGRLNPVELLQSCEPMRKRKLDLAFGDNVYNIGRTPEVVGEGDKEVEGLRQSLFEAVIGRTLREVADNKREDEAKGYMSLMRTPATKSSAPTHEPIPFEPFEDFPAVPPSEVKDTPGATYEPAVDPAISAKETLAKLRTVMKTDKPIPFTKIAPHSDSRAAAATSFMDILVLASKAHVSLAQAKPYADIMISKGSRFDENIEIAGYTTPARSSKAGAASTAKRSKKSK